MRRTPIVFLIFAATLLAIVLPARPSDVQANSRNHALPVKKVCKTVTKKVHGKKKKVKVCKTVKKAPKAKATATPTYTLTPTPTPTVPAMNYMAISDQSVFPGTPAGGFIPGLSTSVVLPQAQSPRATHPRTSARQPVLSCPMPLSNDDGYGQCTVPGGINLTPFGAQQPVVTLGDGRGIQQGDPLTALSYVDGVLRVTHEFQPFIVRSVQRLTQTGMPDAVTVTFDASQMHAVPGTVRPYRVVFFDNKVTLPIDNPDAAALSASDSHLSVFDSATKRDMPFISPIPFEGTTWSLSRMVALGPPLNLGAQPASPAPYSKSPFQPGSWVTVTKNALSPSYDAEPPLADVQLTQDANHNVDVSLSVNQEADSAAVDVYLRSFPKAGPGWTEQLTPSNLQTKQLTDGTVQISAPSGALAAGTYDFRSGPWLSPVDISLAFVALTSGRTQPLAKASTSVGDFFGLFALPGGPTGALPGAASATASVSLKRGWNLVGNPFAQPARIPSGVTAYHWNGSAYDTVTSIPVSGSVWIFDGSSSGSTITLAP